MADVWRDFTDRFVTGRSWPPTGETSASIAGAADPAMSRPTQRSLLRYGIGEEERILADLVKTGLADDNEVIAGGHDVLRALGRSGRPELALSGLADLAANATDWPEIRAALINNARFRGRLIAVLGASTALSDHLADAVPKDWRLLLAELPGRDLLTVDGAYRVLAEAVGVDPDAPRCTGSDGPKAAVTGAPAVIALRKAYRSQLLIIAAHDLAQAVESSLPAVTLPAVCQALAALADATLQVGLTVAATALPASATPVRLGVIAMGKCGGRELNYISDIDVIFAASRRTGRIRGPGRPGGDRRPSRWPPRPRWRRS